MSCAECDCDGDPYNCTWFMVGNKRVKPFPSIKTVAIPIEDISDELMEYFDLNIYIKLLSQQGVHETGSIHKVVGRVKHGGYTDSAGQYILEGDIYVPFDKAVVIKVD